MSKQITKDSERACLEFRERQSSISEEPHTVQIIKDGSIFNRILN
jgi:hypothetical protein